MSEDCQKAIGMFIPRWARPFASILVCAMSSVFMTIAAVMVKMIDTYYSGGVLFVLVARFLGMFVMCVPILCYR